MIYLHMIMDIQKYIASGILENYVLGLASLEEQQELERYVQEYPEIQQELTIIEETLGIYIQAQARPMPKGLDTQILAHIDQLVGATPPPPEQPTASKKEDPKVTPPNSAASGDGWIKGLLALLILLLLLGAGFLYQQTDKLKGDLTKNNQQLTEKNQQLLDHQLACDNTKAELEEQLAILRDDAYRSVLLKGTDKSPDALAAVYYNESDNKTYLDVRNMPAPTTDMQYQLWAIVDGKPVDMGVFNLPIDSVDFVEVPHIANAQAFAVTLETKGGNPTPNLEEIYVIGNT